MIPIYDPRGALVGVLDLDSHQPAAFDEIDREGLERIAERLRASLGGDRVGVLQFPSAS